MIATQRASGATSGDHFAKPGANDRVWNALEKLAVADPGRVRRVLRQRRRGPRGPEPGSDRLPGDLAGQRREPRRRGADRAPRLPPRVPVGRTVRSVPAARARAVAGADAPGRGRPRRHARSSPVRRCYLPHSQKYSHGYVAYRRPEFQEFFESHYVQLPLAKGDAVFFNPALLHAAGSNHSVDIRRMANLLQISSAFGRAMETVDRERVVTAIYPSLLAAAESGMSAAQVENVVAAGAEGYAVPDQPRPRPAGGRHGSAQPGRAPRPGGGQPGQRPGSRRQPCGAGEVAAQPLTGPELVRTTSGGSRTTSGREPWATAVDQVDGGVDRCGRHRHRRLAHGGERHGPETGHRAVVEAHDRDIPRDVETGPPQLVDDTESTPVVEARRTRWAPRRRAVTRPPCPPARCRRRTPRPERPRARPGAWLVGNPRGAGWRSPPAGRRRSRPDGDRGR